MSFYSLLQCDATAIYRMYKNKDDKRAKLITALILRAFLLVLFAVVFITILTTLFGADNSAMAVAIFCILLALRFVDYGYNMKASLLNLGIIFMILTFMPVLASKVNLGLGLLINFVSFSYIILATTVNPKMGNAGLYGFSYVFLAGNPVYGTSLLNRFYMTLVCLVFCGLVYYFKHRNKNNTVLFRDILADFSLHDERSVWQLRLILGVSLALFLGRAFGLERFIWMGFACSSLLSDTNIKDNLKMKAIYRITGVVLGSLLFYVIYNLIPLDFHSYIGMFGGVLLGFASHYHSKTILNCLGALMTASIIYGLDGAIVMRIFDNAVGIIFAILFYLGFNYLIKVSMPIVNRYELTVCSNDYV